MEKLDLRKDLRDLYTAPIKQPAIVEVPEAVYIMVDDKGDPNTTPAFAEAVTALYGLSFTLKFMVKKAQGFDYAVMPLEGLWWMENMAEFSMENKDRWLWTLMIMQPKVITRDLFKEAVRQAVAKKASPLVDKARLETFQEGTCAQIMHIGPYATEPPTIQKLHQFIRDNGYRLRGKHHEIYMGDPRRSAPEKLRTIIRQPIEKAG